MADNLDADYTPKQVPSRDKNAAVVDMNFNGLNFVIKRLKEKVAYLSSVLAASSTGRFIVDNRSQSLQQDAAYNIDLYGMASQGHMHKMTISKDLIIPADWCSQMVNPVVNAGIIVTVEAGGLWFVDA